MAKKKSSRKKLSKKELDLNNDGKVDAKDKSLAAKVLATDIESVVEEPAPEVKEVQKPQELGEYIAKKDINLTYRKGDTVPKEVVDKWKSVGLNISDFF